MNFLLASESLDSSPPPPPDSGGHQPSPSSRQFRFNAQVVFLTFPRCLRPKEDAISGLLAAFPEQVKWAIVCRELHQDQTPHLHLVAKFKRKINSVNPRLFDQVLGEHPNIQSVRSIKNVLKYVRKSDDSPLEHGDVPSTEASTVNDFQKESKSDMVAKALISGATIQQIASDHPGYVLLHLQKMELFRTRMMMKTTTLPTLTSLVLLPDPTMTTEAVQSSTSLVEWVRKNLLAPRAFKDPQLWMWGPPNTRKTSFVHLLKKYYRVYCVPHEEFDDLYEDGLYDLAFCDEWRNDLRAIGWLARFSQGDDMTLRVKGGQRTKSQNIPMIIASNFPINLSFKLQDVDVVRARFQEVHIETPLPLDSFLFQEDESLNQ